MGKILLNFNGLSNGNDPLEVHSARADCGYSTADGYLWTESVDEKGIVGLYLPG